MKSCHFLISIFTLAIFSQLLSGADWPSWGKDQSRNMVSSEKGLTFKFKPGEFNEDESVDLSTTENIKWVAKLGSQSYGNVTIGEGKVIVGTNNESVRDPQKKGDRGVVMCFDEPCSTARSSCSDNPSD